MPSSNGRSGNEFVSQHYREYSVSGLAEAWWKWAAQLPSGSGNNPFEDLSGSAAGMGDVGHNLFFLAGSAGNTESNDPQHAIVTRKDIYIPSNNTVLVPILNWAESLPDLNKTNPTPPATIQDVESTIDTIKGWVQSVFLEVDNVPVALDGNYVKTDFFSIGTIQEHTVGSDAFALGPTGVEQSPAMAGGYWAVLDKLSIGDHTLHFGGSIDTNADGKSDFTLDITDKVHVVLPNEYHTKAALAAPASIWS